MLSPNVMKAGRIVVVLVGVRRGDRAVQDRCSRPATAQATSKERAVQTDDARVVHAIHSQSKWLFVAGRQFIAPARAEPAVP
jgi:hypothetical protein